MKNISVIKLNQLMENLYLESAVNRIYEDAADFDWIRKQVVIPDYPNKPTADRTIKIGGGTSKKPRPIWYVKLGDKVKFISTADNSDQFIFTLEDEDDWGGWGSDMPSNVIWVGSEEGVPNIGDKNYHNLSMLVHPNWVPNIYESRRIKSGVKNVIKDVVEDLGIAPKFITTFGTGIGALYGPVTQLLAGSNIVLTEKEIVLLIITAISFILNDTDFNKLNEKLKEEGLSKHLKGVVEFIEGSKKLLNSVLKKVSNASYGMADILAFTFLLVPTMEVISDLINDYGISSDSVSHLFTGLIAGTTSYAVKSVIKRLGDRL